MYKFDTELALNSIKRSNEAIKTDSMILFAATRGVVSDALTSGDRVQLIGFGTFETVERAERKGHNPKTKEEITIPASTSVKFKAGKALKDAVNA